MVSLGEISRQVRKNISRFHMGDVISPSEVKSTRRELAPNQNTAFHPGNRADVFIWRIFIPPTYDLASHRRDLGKWATSLTHMNAMLILIVKLSEGEIIGRRDVSPTGLIWTGPKSLFFNYCTTHENLQGPVVQKLDSAIRRIVIFSSAVKIFKKL